jgi:tetratricopeptide (TPR) repeat protein
MAFIEKRTDMPPFWKIPKRFFGLPLRTEALLLILASSLCALVMHLNPILAILLSIALSIVITNYAMNLARGLNKANKNTGHVNHQDRVPGIASAFDFRWLKDCLIITGVLWLSLAPVMLFLNYINGVSAFIYALISFPILPSILLMLLYTDKRHSINKRHSTDKRHSTHHALAPSWINIIKKMKLSYISLVSYFALSFVSALIGIDLLMQVLPDYALAPISTLVISYLLLSLFAALAYVLIRYDSFSSSIIVANEFDQEAHPVDPKQRFNADLDIAIKEGDYSKALNLLESTLKGKRSDLRVHQLYTLLLEHRDLEGLEKRSHLFLELLLGRGQKLAAYELVELLRTERDQFLVHDIALSLELAEAFYSMKEYKLSLWLAQDAHTRFDPSPELAKLYLLCAKIIAKSKTPGKARGYLQYIIKNHPDTEFHQQSTRLLEHLDSRN